MALEQDQNKKPDFVMAQSNSMITPLVEVSAVCEDDDLEMFGITKDDKLGLSASTSTAYDGDLNPLTFNHVKSSGAFAKRHSNRFGNNLSLIEEEDLSLYKDGKYTGGNQDENDFNQWLAKSKQAASAIGKKSEDGWG